MIRYLVFFIVSTLILVLCSYLTIYCSSCSSDTEIDNAARKYDMVREAELVSHFCFSKKPPIIGQVSIPRAWETALNASIQVFDNSSETTSSFSELGERQERIGKLAAGESVYAESDKDRILVFRPKQSPDWYIVLSKPLSTLKESAATTSCIGAGGILIYSILGSLVLTVLARFIFGRTAAQA